MDVTLGKLNHYTIVTGYFNAQRGKEHPMESATDIFEFEMRNERGDTLVEWVT